MLFVTRESLDARTISTQSVSKILKVSRVLRGKNFSSSYIANPQGLSEELEVRRARMPPAETEKSRTI